MRTSFASLLSLTLLAAIGAAGCGDSGPSADAACARRARVVCAKRQQCSQGYDIQRNFGTLANCEMQEKQVCLESVNRTGSGNTPSRTEKCTDATEKQTCEQRAAGVEIPACAAGDGEFKLSQPCISPNQCASSYCDIPPGQTCGKCANKVADGMPCDSSGDCAEGSYCQRPPMTVMGTCAKFQAVGGACNDVLRCGAGVSCVGFSRSMGIDGTCTARTVAEGQICNNTDKLCVVGLNCVGFSASTMTDGTCRKPKTAEGDTCDRRNRADVDCDGSIGLYCRHETADAPTGTCAKRLGVATGISCGLQSDGSNPFCQKGDVCQRPPNPTTGMPDTTMPGTCVAQVGEGMTCNTDGNIGPGCLPTYTCVLKSPGVSTEGTCRKRTYEVLCNVK